MPSFRLLDDLKTKAPTSWADSLNELADSYYPGQVDTSDWKNGLLLRADEPAPEQASACAHYSVPVHIGPCRFASSTLGPAQSNVPTDATHLEHLYLGKSRRVCDAQPSQSPNLTEEEELAFMYEQMSVQDRSMQSAYATTPRAFYAHSGVQSSQNQASTAPRSLQVTIPSYDQPQFRQPSESNQPPSHYNTAVRR